MTNSTRKIRAARTSLATTIILTGLKLLAALATGSLAVLSSAIDSLLDIFMSSANYFAIRQAELPPDPKHPFGHGKFETLATIFQAMMIALSGLWILYESTQRLIHGSNLARLEEGMVVLLISSVVSWKIASYLKTTAKATESSALKADALHFSMDIYTNIALVGGLGLVMWLDTPWLDPVLSLLVGCYILFEAYRLVRYGMSDILDEQLPDSIRQEIAAIIDLHQAHLIDYHRLRTRRAGSQKIIDFHLTVCKHLTVKEAHEIADHLEERIRTRIGGSDVTIHIEPCIRSDCNERQPCPKDSPPLEKGS
ncbi:cation transporter [Syntrophotalea acetylenivorans]|uniref:Cation transporter n=1 Tax=Syntrophotalea acetylenivorans TaxID=1842532 RepID=A0A1L3GLZ9_9BACT|nr:cation diffusion facilitator family transporter [Syntrophotalea acetylenivorans]APG26952.1 cation transporter [Syntrophotalea acetylenivorans]